MISLVAFVTLDNNSSTFILKSFETLGLNNDYTTKGAHRRFYVLYTLLTCVKCGVYAARPILQLAYR